MRVPKSLSPSAFGLWKRDTKEYTLKYLCDNKPPRSPQEMPAAVGSSFDAWVKAALHKDLFGKNVTPEFQMPALFESQVEEHNRDRAWHYGLRCFENYVATGAYADLRTLLGTAKETPRFEFEVGGIIEGIPLGGKPDCYFITANDIHVILDWKVKGYCSKWNASPSPLYGMCRDGIGWPKPSRSHGTSHKGYVPIDFHGIEIHAGSLETSNPGYAVQLAIYGWLIGIPPDADNVVFGIDELVSKSRLEDNLPPLLRIAQHRARISQEFQRQTLIELHDLWDCIQSGYIRQDLSREESDAWFGACQKAAVGRIMDTDDDYYSQLGQGGYYR